MKSENKEKYRRAAEKGVKWILSCLYPDGSFGPAAKEFSYYYKTAWALIDTGYMIEAMKLLDYVKKTHLMDDGDFNQKLGKHVDDPIWHAYLNTWLIIGAHKLGRFDISFKGMQYILNLQDPVNGGFFCKKPSEEGGDEHVIISSSCGLACLYTGMLDEAKKAGDFFMRIMEMQPEKEKRFYSVFHSKKGLVTRFPPEKSQIYVVEAEKTRQWWFTIGHPIGFLTKLYLATNCEKYLEGAKEYFNFTDSCVKQPEGVFSWPASGKIGWGSAVLYNVTGDPRYAEAAKAVADYLVETQSPDGYWLGYVSRFEDQPLFNTVAITAEFVVWLREILQELKNC